MKKIMVALMALTAFALNQKIHASGANNDVPQAVKEAAEDVLKNYVKVEEYQVTAGSDHPYRKSGCRRDAPSGLMLALMVKYDTGNIDLDPDTGGRVPKFRWKTSKTRLIGNDHRTYMEDCLMVSPPSMDKDQLKEDMKGRNNVRYSIEESHDGSTPCGTHYEIHIEVRKLAYNQGRHMTFDQWTDVEIVPVNKNGRIIVDCRE